MSARASRLALCAFLLAPAGCGRGESGGDLRARKVMLQREVEGLREMAAAILRHEALVPEGDVAVAIDESLVRDLLAAQLPFEAEVERFRVHLGRAEVRFRGSPAVTLGGSLALKGSPALAGEVSVLGALDHIAIDAATGTLRARVQVDHIDIQKAAGVESFLSGGALDELARRIRLQLQGKLPDVQIPVKVQQGIELPAVTEGPVRLDGASLPLQAAVSRVFAGQGRLWVAVNVRPGDFVKTRGPSAPPAAKGRP